MQKVVAITARGARNVVSGRPIPTLLDDCLLVKTVSVALNPTDWKSADRGPPGLTIGNDYSGIVEEVGKGVKKQFRKGDRVCGWVQGCKLNNPESGAFAEYCIPKADLQIVIPERLSFQEAATLGLGTITVGQGLYQSLKLAPPDAPLTKPELLLVYGGSTATGTLAIQYAKLSGYTVLTTCSKQNFDLVKSLGADAAFDYKDPNAIQAVKDYAQDQLKLVFDTVGGAEFCEQVISSQGGHYSAIVHAAVDRDDVKNSFTLGYTAFGEDFDFGGGVIPAKPEDREFAAEFMSKAATLLADGKIKPHPAKVGAGGLQGVLEGLQAMKDGKVSGQKLVYNVAETP
ncbi:zinc-binding alcohol dehydrogenase family protein [Aspergillus ibericus CBS 121593]|uniref:GroES-like protein n=1 Tax=Aspergillus ibericus CBS 121593 TaxID=1448316 RepID=A0A395GN87_9EURO|nr:GroES-like protein [Aspergillus ibericus CBS 121593]RAK95483.1 GroES-like protein [Aspergillus ibericus CBS 121593]